MMAEFAPPRTMVSGGPQTTGGTTAGRDGDGMSDVVTHGTGAGRGRSATAVFTAAAIEIGRAHV